MKSLILLVVFSSLITSAFAVGTVNFSNIGTVVTTSPDSVFTGAPVPAGAQFRAALYFAAVGTTDPNAFSPIGAESTFLAPGTIIGGTRTAPLTSNGGLGLFQIRVWEVATGPDYATATHRGASNIITVDTGDPTTIPPGIPSSLTAAGLQSFQLSTVPEPSSSLLLALAFGTIFRRRRR